MRAGTVYLQALTASDIYGQIWLLIYLQNLSTSCDAVSNSRIQEWLKNNAFVCIYSKMESARIGLNSQAFEPQNLRRKMLPFASSQIIGKSLCPLYVVDVNDEHIWL